KHPSRSWNRRSKSSRRRPPGSVPGPSRHSPPCSRGNSTCPRTETRKNVVEAPAMLAQLVRRKSVDDAHADSERPEGALKRSLTAIDLTALGIGAIIGAGVFSSTGTAAAGKFDALGHMLRPGAGSALILSYVVTAVACGFAALCYAEMAAMI